MKRCDRVGIAKAQALSRAVIHDVAASLRAGDREADAARRIEDRLKRAGVRHWLHTAYAWWGDRARFARFTNWEPDALPTERRLREGESFILDVAPLVDGHPADYAFSGVLGGELPPDFLSALAEMKSQIVALVREALTGRELFRAVGEAARRRGFDAVHPLYPAGVLGHALHELTFTTAPRIGDGFQLPLVGSYALAILRHFLFGAPYPFISDLAPDRPSGLFAVEPHLGRGDAGAKFESILLIDGDETRWLDPELFGEVVG